MNFNQFKNIYLSNYFLINYNSLLDNKIIESYLSFLAAISQEEDIEAILLEYNLFLLNLLNHDLSQIVKEIILEINIQNMDNQKQAIEKEIDILKELFNIQFIKIKEILKENYPNYIDVIGKMPEYKNEGLKITIDEIIAIADKKQLNSKSIDYSCQRTFIFDEDLILKPIDNTQTITFADLKGYCSQKKVLYQNTEAFLQGKKVNNVLLYGDAGCGKSSSVRALLNEFSELRMVQIFKNNLINLDKLYSILKELPYKFIIFADDISFKDNDETFSTMKAILEGALIECPDNAVVYATSNRRHLINETFKQRQGDEIHLNDTINELNSLSERFGISLLFQKPTNEEFNEIVLELAKDSNLDINNALLEKAQRFTLLKGSKSPRIAKQFIDNLKAGIEF